MAVLALLKVGTVDGRSPRELIQRGLFPPFSLGYHFAQVAQRIARDPGPVVVHGWDWRAYVYFSAWTSGAEPPSYPVSDAQRSVYFESIRRRHAKYIVDTVTYPNREFLTPYSLAAPSLWGDSPQDGYRRVSDELGLVVYQR